MRILPAVALLLSGSAWAGELRVKSVAITNLVDEAFFGTKAHLDHDAAGAGGKASARSYFELGPALGARRLTFSVPDQSVDLGAMGTVVYQLHDVNLSRMEVSAADGAFVLTLFFEDRGTEIVARSNGTMGRLSGAVPDIQMNDMRLELSFAVSGPKQKAALTGAKATFKADIRSEGGVAALGGGRDVLDDATGYKQQLREGIEQQAQSALASPEVLSTLNSLLWQEIRSRVGEQDVRGAWFEGEDLVIEYGPPPPRRTK